jgi:hypothetical protein
MLHIQREGEFCIHSFTDAVNSEAFKLPALVGWECADLNVTGVDPATGAVRVNVTFEVPPAVRE